MKKNQKSQTQRTRELANLTKVDTRSLDQVSGGRPPVHAEIAM